MGYLECFWCFLIQFILGVFPILALIVSTIDTVGIM